MPSPSPPPPHVRRRPGIIGRAERCCSLTFKFFPLAFVYGVTTWAIWTQGQVCLRWDVPSWIAYTTLFLSLFLYAMSNWCYTVAVFTDPGSPLHPVGTPAHFSRHNYSFLPLTEPRDTNVLSLTVKSSGATRFCKKCQCKKPDRAHHCSTCGRCVLKMDHHCPWLATCVGLQNYKPFLLFCIYVTLLCWVCLGASATFVTFGVQKKDMVQYGELFAVNSVLLAIVAGIFGLVLAGFTGWHISLALCNQTTIECLEKTRYLRPIRRTMDRATYAFPGRGGGGGGGGGRGEDEGLLQHYGHQLAEIHANAIPGITRPEEGEESVRAGARPGDGRIDLGEAPYTDAEPSTRLLPPPQQQQQQGATHAHPGTQVLSDAPQSAPSATSALRQNFAELEAERERARYDAYLDEQEGEKMPNAFDLGWRRNLLELFGDVPLYWVFPVCNTRGDGWRWEPSAAWLRAQEERRRRREERDAGQQQRTQHPHYQPNSHVYSDGIWDGTEAHTDYNEHRDGERELERERGRARERYDPAGIPRGDDDDDDFFAQEEQGFRGVHEPIVRGGANREADAETGSTDALFAVDDGEEDDEEEEGGRDSEEAAWGW